MVSTPLKNISQIGFIFPNFRGENSKNIWVATTQFCLPIIRNTAESLTSSQARGWHRIISKQRCQPSGAAATALKAALQQMISDERWLFSAAKKHLTAWDWFHFNDSRGTYFPYLSILFYFCFHVWTALVNHRFWQTYVKDSVHNEPWSLWASAWTHGPRNIGLRTFFRHRLQQVTSLAFSRCLGRKQTNRDLDFGHWMEKPNQNIWSRVTMCFNEIEIGGIHFGYEIGHNFKKGN